MHCWGWGGSEMEQKQMGEKRPVLEKPHIPLILTLSHRPSPPTPPPFTTSQAPVEGLPL